MCSVTEQAHVAVISTMAPANRTYGPLTEAFLVIGFIKCVSKQHKVFCHVVSLWTEAALCEPEQIIKHESLLFVLRSTKFITHDHH